MEEQDEWGGAGRCCKRGLQKDRRKLLGGEVEVTILMHLLSHPSKLLKLYSLYLFILFIYLMCLFLYLFTMSVA